MNQLMTINDICDSCPSKCKKPIRDGCLPRMVTVIGLIMEVRKIRLVGWKEEVIVTLTDAENALLDVSSWNTHESPNFAKSADMLVYKGKIAIIKRVNILCQETDEYHRRFYGEINGKLPRSILVLNIDASNYTNFMEKKEPFEINQHLSDVPVFSRKKRAGLVFPIWSDEMEAMEDVIHHVPKFYDASNLTNYGNFFELQKSGFHDWLKSERKDFYESEIRKKALKVEDYSASEVITYACNQ